MTLLWAVGGVGSRGKGRHRAPQKSTSLLVGFGTFFFSSAFCVVSGLERTRLLASVEMVARLSTREDVYLQVAGSLVGGRMNGRKCEEIQELSFP